MNRIILKLKAVWFLLRSDGYILTYAKNPMSEAIDAGFFFSGLEAEMIILLCDSLADEIEADMKEEEDKIMSDKIGKGMINFLNLN